MKLENKYARIYSTLIGQAQSRSINEGVEIHHIVPRSLGGSNSSDNTVALTLREHFVAHWLLTKMYDGEARRKMLFALATMSRGRTLTSRQFAVARAARIQAQTGKKASDETRAKMSLARKGKKFSEEARLSFSLAKIGKPLSESHRAAVSVGQVGRSRGPCSEARRQAIKLANTGKPKGPMSTENKIKISVANTGKVRTPEMIERYKKAWEVRRAKCA